MRAEKRCGVDQVIGYSTLVAVPAAQPDTLPSISGGLPAIRSARPSWCGHDASGQRDVRRPLPGQRVGHRAGLQVRQAQPVHLGVHVQQLGRRHHQPGQHHLGPAEQQRRADPAREREPIHQRPQQRVHGGVDPLGDRQRRVRAAGRRLTGDPASRRSSQMCRTAASVSASKTSSTEWTIVRPGSRPTAGRTRTRSSTRTRRRSTLPRPPAAPPAPAPAPQARRGCPSRRPRLARPRTDHQPGAPNIM